MRRVVPKVRDVLHLASQDLQEAAAAAFVKIAEDQSVPHLTYAQTFLQTILQNADNRDPDISDSWLEVLLNVITHLPKDVLKKDILPVALSKGQLAQSVQSRLASCRLLGKIATRFDTFMIKKEILPLVTSLCQDVDYEVRACMCKQLDSVARGLGLEPTRSAILPELVELGKDEESCVRLAALETIVSLLSLLDDVNFIPPDTCTQTIIPLVRKFCENAMNNEDSTLPSVAKQFGRLCHGLSVNLTEELKLWFMKYYYKLCSLGLNEKSISNDRLNSPMLSMYREEHRLTECRQYSAYNFPCMVLFAGARKFKAELHGTFASLCDDPHPQVRATLACGFHEVAHLLGNNVSCIHGELVSLLKDENLQVLQGITSHLPETLVTFSKGALSSSGHHLDNKVYGVGDLIPAILAAESRASNSRNWRLHVDILEKLACLPKCLTSDQIHSKFIPLFFKHVTSHRALPIQHAAARTLCVLMRNCRKLDHRQDMVAKLIHECCRSKSSRYRRLYIDICVIVMEMFSKSFFKDNFMEPLMDLTADPVPNIRLKMCSLLPRIKHQMKLPEDRENLQALELVVRRLLSSEKDKDVDVAIRQAVFELDRIQVHVDSLNMSQYYEDDMQDRKKEAEERSMMEIERRNMDEGIEKGAREKGSARHTEKKKEKESKTEKNVHTHSQSNPASAPSTSSRKVSKSTSHKHSSTPSGGKSFLTNGPQTSKNIASSSSTKSSVSNGPHSGKNVASSSTKSSVSNGTPTGKNIPSSSAKSLVSNGPPSGKHNAPTSSSRKTSPPQGPPMNTAIRAASHKAQKAPKSEVSSAPPSRTSTRAGKKSPSATLLEPNNNVKSTTRTTRVLEYSSSLSSPTASSAAKRSTSGTHVSESRKSSASSVSSTRSGNSSSSHLSTSTSSTRVRKSTHKT
ncbi:serine/threonine-protein phosphatase 4 regulatory subunit 4-like isoform X6 [Lytechinus pictus]|uniref:serine/threonine-protein phosphatase 4 regulatory subunit 4-like isoform X6 n=1 Tax=Lytechinus pictus TaxID=7653 RepID=UPI0030B9E917